MRRHRFRQLFTILVSLSLFNCGEEENIDPRIQAFLNDPTKGKYDIVEIPSGQTVELTNTSKLVVKEYADIKGTLIIENTPEDEFSIIVENGDLTISGTIILKNRDTIASANGRVAKTTNLNAPDLILSANAPNATLYFLRQSYIHTDNGKDAPILIANKNTSKTGTNGGNGGNVILEAVNGTVEFEKAVAGDPPIFQLGNGGNGGDVKMDRDYTTLSNQSLVVTGGNGGDGGNIIIDTQNILGLLSLSDLQSTQYHYIKKGSGMGGDGGCALWDNTIDGILGDLPAITSEFRLSSINLKGGDGGNSLVSGGTGGAAVYWCDRIINERPRPIITTVNTTGGNGGNIIGSMIPVYEAWGGDGGAVTVWGNHGWHGDKDFKKGADGGDVYFQMGDGGDVIADVKSVRSYGGAGGNNLLAREQLPRKLGIETNYLDAPFWIMVGRGGNGYRNCEGCPGGRGGDAGKVRAGKAGNGGDVLNEPLDASSSRTGDGGNVWSVVNNQPGDGGNGSPPGKAGCVPPQNIMPGVSGDGNIPKGNDGKNMANEDEITHPVGSCGKDGDWCGQDLTCTPELPTKETGCWSADGASYSWAYKQVVYSTDGKLLRVITEQGAEVFGNPGQLQFTRVDIAFNLDGSPKWHHSLDQEETNFKYGGPPAPYCLDGVVLDAGSTINIEIEDAATEKIVKTENYTYGGCIPTWEELGYTAQEQQDFFEQCGN